MSFCPVSLVYLEGEVNGWRNDYMFTELLFYLEQAKCNEGKDAINENIGIINANIDTLIEGQIKKNRHLNKVLIDNDFGLLDSEITALAHTGDDKFGLEFEPLVELAEALRAEDYIQKVPKSVYYATFGLRCMVFFKEKGNNVFLMEAFKALGYAEQEYCLETPEAERQEAEKIKAEKISLCRSTASKSGHAKRHSSWKPYIKVLYETTDWKKVLKKVNRSQQVDYIVGALQEKLNNNKDMFQGNGVTPRWVGDFLRKEYGPAKKLGT